MATKPKAKPPVIWPKPGRWYRIETGPKRLLRDGRVFWLWQHGGAHRLPIKCYWEDMAGWLMETGSQGLPLGYKPTHYRLSEGIPDPPKRP